jgi:hypothetical protein
MSDNRGRPTAEWSLKAFEGVPGTGLDHIVDELPEETAISHRDP